MSAETFLPPVGADGDVEAKASTDEGAVDEEEISLFALFPLAEALETEMLEGSVRERRERKREREFTTAVKCTGNWRKVEVLQRRAEQQP